MTNDKSQAPWIAYATLALVMLFWAGNSIVGRAVRGDIGPFTLALIRWTGALIVLSPFAWRHFSAQLPQIRLHWRPVLLLGILGVAGFNGFLYSGLRYTSATNGLLLQAAIPALVLLVDRLIFGVRSTIGQVIGVTVSTIGVVLIVLRGDMASLLGLELGKGDALVLCGVLVWSLYTSLLKLKPAVHPLSFLFATFIIGVLCMAPLAAGEIVAHGLPQAKSGVVLACAYVALFPSVISYLLFNQAVERIGAAKAGQTIALMPLFGAGLAVMLLGEPLHAYHLAGMAIILAGIAMSALTRRA